jgi:hypothetical protein
MKGLSSSSNQKMSKSSSQELIVVLGPTFLIEHLNNHVDDDNDAPTISKRERTTKYFGNNCIMYLMDDTPTSILEASASQNVDY